MVFCYSSLNGLKNQATLKFQDSTCEEVLQTFSGEIKHILFKGLAKIVASYILRAVLKVRRQESKNVKISRENEFHTQPTHH